MAIFIIFFVFFGLFGLFVFLVVFGFLVWFSELSCATNCA